MTSLATIITYKFESSANGAVFANVLRNANTPLYMIWKSLEESNVNPVLIPPIIKNISFVDRSSGYGKVIIFMEKNHISNLSAEIKTKIDAPVEPPEQILVGGDFIVTENPVKKSLIKKS